MGWKIQLNCI